MRSFIPFQIYNRSNKIMNIPVIKLSMPLAWIHCSGICIDLYITLQLVWKQIGYIILRKLLMDRFAHNRLSECCLWAFYTFETFVMHPFHTIICELCNYWRRYTDRQTFRQSLPSVSWIIWSFLCAAIVLFFARFVGCRIVIIGIIILSCFFITIIGIIICTPFPHNFVCILATRTVAAAVTVYVSLVSETRTQK